MVGAGRLAPILLGGAEMRILLLILVLILLPAATKAAREDAALPWTCEQARQHAAGKTRAQLDAFTKENGLPPITSAQWRATQRCITRK